MDMQISLPGGKRVEVRYKDFVITTDQAVEAGGQGSAPEPYALFLASLGACAGYYVLAFCQNRGIPTEGIGLTQRTLPGADGKGLGRIEIEVSLPAAFPEKYEKAVLRAADACAVKKTILNPPEMVITSRRV
jgi:ribosomal protein S12 methylthiotransferase accessory factor